MATTYTHKKVESDFEIYRNDAHVATYDPITEDVTYTHGNDKYAAPVGRVIAEIVRDNPVAVTPPTEETPTEETPTEETPTEETPTGKLNGMTEKEAELIATNRRLRGHIQSLEREIVVLKRGGKEDVKPERFKDTIDESEAPVKDPMLGDLTPDYIEWARKGGMTPEVFKRRYHNRIKDLSTPE